MYKCCLFELKVLERNTQFICDMIGNDEKMHRFLLDKLTQPLRDVDQSRIWFLLHQAHAEAGKPPTMQLF